MLIIYGNSPLDEHAAGIEIQVSHESQLTVGMEYQTERIRFS